MKEINSLEELPNLGRNDVHVVFIEQTKAIQTIDTSVLSLEELQYVNRFIRPEDRHNKMLGKCITRRVLERYGATAPANIHIERNAFGKPFCIDKTLPKFNLSDSKDTVVIGISREEIGVDIEYINSNFEYADVIANLFSVQDQRAITADKDPSRAFYSAWAIKEAQLKAIGRDMQEEIPTAAYYCWSDIINGYAFAVAVKAGQYQLQFFKYLANKI